MKHVSAQGGQPELLSPSEPETGILASWPKFLPGSRAILYEASTVRGNLDNSSILVRNLETGETRTVIQTGANPFYASTGHIIYALSGNLMAVPFDLESLTVRGNPVTVAEDILFDPDNLAYRYGFSQEGSLFFVKSVQEGGNNLVWVDRNGIETEVPAASHLYWDPRVSPDGRRVAVNARDAGNDIWVYDLSRGSLSRLTHDPGEDETAFWSSNGRWIAFSSSRAGQPRSIYRKLSDGSGEEELLWTGAHHMHVDSWSADGKSIILTDDAPTTLQDLWVLNLEGEPSTQPLLRTPYRESNGRISPDGHWIAYESDESGQWEIYIQAFPGLGKKVLVSTRGGNQAIWSHDGSELFYRGEGSIMAVKVQSGETLSVTPPKPLFRDQYALRTQNHHISFSVSKDGKQFLMLKGEPQTHITHLEVVNNWFDEVKRKAPTGK